MEQRLLQHYKQFWYSSLWNLRAPCLISVTIINNNISSTHFSFALRSSQEAFRPSMYGVIMAPMYCIYIPPYKGGRAVLVITVIAVPLMCHRSTVSTAALLTLNVHTSCSHSISFATSAYTYRLKVTTTTPQTDDDVWIHADHVDDTMYSLITFS